VCLLQVEHNICIHTNKKSFPSDFQAVRTAVGSGAVPPGRRSIDRDYSILSHSSYTVRSSRSGVRIARRSAQPSVSATKFGACPVPRRSLSEDVIALGRGRRSPGPGDRRGSRSTATVGKRRPVGSSGAGRRRRSLSRPGFRAGSRRSPHTISVSVRRACRQWGRPFRRTGRSRSDGRAGHGRLIAIFRRGSTRRP
jgi:hypothetical protein